MSMYADIINRFAKNVIHGGMDEKQAINLCIDIMYDLEWLSDADDERAAQKELKDTIRLLRKQKAA